MHAEQRHLIADLTAAREYADLGSDTGTPCRVATSIQ